VVAQSGLLHLAGQAPLVGIEALCGSGDVLVLAPHPDDESLGCGLAIASAVSTGRKVALAVVTDGSRSHPGSRSCPPERLADLRRAEVRQAFRILTANAAAEPLMLAYRDTASPGTGREIAAAVRRLQSWMPSGTTAIWTTWDGDPHVDHVRTAALARAVAEAQGALGLWFFPIWGRFAEGLPTGIGPGRIHRFEAPEFTARKRSALACHASQMTRLIDDDPGGFVMSPEHQAHFLAGPEIFIRGAS
jgi:LmbE family N-acetylglucosaminyl deacetylase